MVAESPTAGKEVVTDTSETTDNPFFARLWTFLSNHETEEIQRLRTENLAGLSGRVLEVGAGTGTNFAYPATVTEVVAVEPERRLAAGAGGGEGAVPAVPRAPSRSSGSLARAVRRRVCSLVLCSIDDPDTVLRRVFSLTRPGGELRYLEHVGSPGFRGRLQEDRRRHRVAAVDGQLPHASQHRSVDRRRGLRRGPHA